MAEESRGAGRNVIPTPLPDDHEDVSWALSTAQTTWERGEFADALKWLRRAAESASEAEADDRALELAKVAADLATQLDIRAASVAPDPGVAHLSSPPAAPSRVPPQRLSAPPAHHPSRPAPGRLSRPPAGRSSAPPLPPRAAGLVGKAEPAARPAPVRAQRSRVAPPPPPITSPDAERAARMANDERDEIAAEMPDNTAPVAVARARRRPISDLETTIVSNASRRSVPDAAWHLDTAEAPAFAPPDADRPLPPPPAPPSNPTGFDDVPKTRIGTPAYREEAISASSPPDPVPPPPRDDRVTARGPVEKPMQAVRVVVWRGPNGVHIAPRGTTVSAISIDAMLVALDPGADLYAWLTNE